ncbi:hypothetical protein Agabi119p4_10464 [Agaricus bisporus var. burnettii]|uniref:Fe2OG dioxygenase domain-containing protein n=1 Tax=Agaricus bisporus var. burnettii TaxID=192524 RepID=A0A8H7C2Z2_AGABI|nr:hypothetical protein Agabi119p4_10464 [Agaricus bisporus var. burnettii]
MTTTTRASRPPLVDPQEPLGSGDSRVVYDLLPSELAGDAYAKLVEEVDWIKMLHRGGEVPRLVAQQGEIIDEDGSYPIYRHPADESPPLLPFTPTVQLIRDHVQKVLNHPVNHVLIQHYRTGADYISDHSDKTIDINRHSFIVNVSLGAQRVMTLRQKKDQNAREQERQAGSTPTSSTSTDSISHHTQPPPRPTQRIPLPDNSLFILGLETNKKWLHGISTDKRPLSTKSPVEQINNGARISLTFRWIGTFVNPTRNTIWGIGARAKNREDARTILDGTTNAAGMKDAENLITAFGEENFNPDFDWEKWYGEGFDVLHFKVH